MKIKPLICIICFVLFLAYRGTDTKSQVKYYIQEGSAQFGAVIYTVTLAN